jgi:hypothetical protein
MKIRILAYCIVNNRFHLVLKNSSGRMPECMNENKIITLKKLLLLGRALSYTKSQWPGL